MDEFFDCIRIWNNFLVPLKANVINNKINTQLNGTEWKRSVWREMYIRKVLWICFHCKKHLQND